MTIASDRGRVDLALPLRAPVADLMPQILELCVSDDARRPPRRWSLARIGSAPFEPDAELGPAGLRHAEVLILTAHAGGLRPAHLDDVRDAVEDMVDEGGADWHRNAHLRCLLGVLAAVALGIGAAAVCGAFAPRLTWVAALSLLPALWFATEWMRRRDEIALAVVLVGLTSCWTGLFGWFAPWWEAAAGSAGSGSPWLTATRLVVAVTAAVVVAVLLRNVSLVATGVVAAAAVGFVAALALAASIAAELPPRVGTGICAVAAALGVGVLPRVAVTVGGLTELDRRVRTQRGVSRAVLTTRLSTADTVLTGSLTGIALVAGTAASFLAGRDDPWARLLGVAVALALVTRSRLFSRVAQVTVLRLAGVGGCVTTVIRLVVESTTVWIAGGVLGIGVAVLLGVAALSVRPVSEVGAARLTRAASVAEWCVVASLLPLLAATWGLFGWIAELSR